MNSICSNWTNSSVLTKPIALSSSLLPLQPINHAINEHSSVTMELWTYLFFLLYNWSLSCFVFYFFVCVLFYFISSISFAVTNVKEESLDFTKHKFPCQLQQLFQRLICWFSNSLSLNSIYCLPLYREAILQQYPSLHVSRSMNTVKKIPFLSQKICIL